VDSQEATANGMTARDANRQCDRYRHDRRQSRQEQVLGDAGRDAVRADPVLGRGEPGQDLDRKGHTARRVQGVTWRWMSTSAPSSRIASAIDPPAPSTSGVAKNCWIPWMINAPRPPCPISAVTVTRPTVVTTATR